ncbi:hypothetical protein GALL_327470 [mine drainage metagenome]|uniref:DUF2802 domain-containing protein n=1 Tax=mine drainage metagenome TaxID=410659 RepID=A0A1J5R6S0_9ZZZZ
MQSIVITWRELLIVVALILAVYIAEMLLLMRTGGSLLRKPRWLGIIREKHDELGLQHELEQIKERLAQLEARQFQPPEVEIDVASPYQRAIQLARQGRDITTISETCGISRGEAELIITMHGVRE